MATQASTIAPTQATRRWTAARRREAIAGILWSSPWVLGFFFFMIFIFVPLRLGALLGGTYVPGDHPYIVVPICFLGLLTFFYFGGRNDSAKILRNLTRVLTDDHAA